MEMESYQERVEMNSLASSKTAKHMHLSLENPSFLSLSLHLSLRVLQDQNYKSRCYKLYHHDGKVKKCELKQVQQL